jgi:zinc transporter 1/2/3
MVLVVGVLLTITPDSELVILFAVILVHQLFEGLALGARIEPMEKIRDSTKVMMGVAFSVTCPIGMGIGIGVRKSFNGNDRNTILVLGIMNALSAGVLAWVAFVELWSKDWMHGELRTANAKKTTIAMVSLISGIVLMGVLGAWA